MLLKKKRLKNKAAIHNVKKKGYCEYCGGHFNLQAHHVLSKGSGGPDHELNLICLCVECHTKAHAGNIEIDDLWEIIGRREMMLPEMIAETIRGMM